MSGALTAAVVGAGAIGARLDRPGTATPLTHAGGCVAAGFCLVGLVDPAPDTSALAQRWGCPAFASVAQLVGAKPDLVSIAAPTAVHAALLREVVALRPRAVIAEKPLAGSLAEAEALAALYAEADIPLIVNYTRRFTPLWRALAPTEALSATFRYGKGVMHNGTHAIDLCRMLFGACLEARALGSRFDFWPADPSVSAYLRFERCPEVFLQAMDEGCFTFFEADIVAPGWRLVVDHDGRRARRFERREGVGVPPGRRLVESGVEDAGAADAMRVLMSHVRAVIDGKTPWCGAADAVAAQRVATSLLP